MDDSFDSLFDAMSEILASERKRMGFMWIGTVPNKGSGATFWARDGRFGWLWTIALDKKWRPLEEEDWEICAPDAIFAPPSLPADWVGDPTA